jgi:hypothetical protein
MHRRRGIADIRLGFAAGRAPEKGKEGKGRKAGKNSRTAQILVRGLPLIDRTTLQFSDSRHASSQNISG